MPYESYLKAKGQEYSIYTTLKLVKWMEKNYEIFISYRRKGGYETAKHLYDLLTKEIEYEHPQ